jgi:hypothetical protein
MERGARFRITQGDDKAKKKIRNIPRGIDIFHSPFARLSAFSGRWIYLAMIAGSLIRGFH